MAKYKAEVELVSKHYIEIEAESEELAYDELDTNGDLLSDKSAYHYSWTVSKIEEIIK